MITATHSVRQGAVKIFRLGIRAVSLSLIVSLFTLLSPSSAQADQSQESTAVSETEVRGAESTSTETAEQEDDAPQRDAVTGAVPPASLEKVAVEKISEPTIRHIGPVTTITEVSSGLPFPARVDTGATTCSIHYEAIEIEDAAASPAENVGKRVRILIQNPEGDKEWINTKIVDHVTVRTTTDDEDRYKVRLKLRWQDVEKHVLVTLKDREKMKYPLLVGRNFLRGDFLVDVNLDAD